MISNFLLNTHDFAKVRKFKPAAYICYYGTKANERKVL